MLECGVLKLGSFKAKSGRQTPYFLDAGRYGTGAQLKRLGGFYADRLLATLGDGFDVLFGPAYKGIPLVVATATALAERGRDVGFCFNRKEAKDHGEGGVLVGHKLQNGERVVIVEDVTTAGTSIRETVPILRAAAQVELTRADRFGRSPGAWPGRAQRAVRGRSGVRLPHALDREHRPDHRLPAEQRRQRAEAHHARARRGDPRVSPELRRGLNGSRSSRFRGQ